jgi:hypothetical protein
LRPSHLNEAGRGVNGFGSFCRNKRTSAAGPKPGIYIDVNHSLTGGALNFDIKIVSVRESTEEERSHGHAH